MEAQKEAYWSDTRPPVDADANEVWEQLERIREEYSDGINAENVVEDARDENTPLHPVIYRHSDEQAAKLYRKKVARRVVQSIEVKVEAPDKHEEPTKAFVNVKDHDGNRKYKPTEEVLNDEDLRQQALENVLQSIVTLQEKHDQYERLSEILATAQRRIEAEIGGDGEAAVTA
jgi:hypothetical protein